ncbi:MHS family MFS transporter [Arthrobacter bambusae]|uniref:MFS transporter n=1 Tax=Arthrobacter bambusae TaxID=1338426 RepID=UPI001F51434F|nr:MFS transporter [Arthrobacter bambusae]MCI0144247.1 MHS family MFS transporter [Arthrobacter bambusae]
MASTQGIDHTAVDEPTVNRRQMRNVYIASLAGTTVEFYDFIVFGAAASLVFGAVFFSSLSPSVGTIASFAILASGYAARPLGGIIFGHLGDKMGRKATLMWTMGLMGGSTVLIGLIPPSAQIGVLAPILLVVLRLVQGIAVGGEWGGAMMIAVEHAPAKRRGIFGGAAPLGSGLGVLLAYGMIALVSNLGNEAFLSWGWRVPFLLSSVLIGLGFYVRLKIEESPVFTAAKKQAHMQDTSAALPKTRIPLFELFRERPKALLLGIGISCGPFMAQAILTTSMIAYATTQYHIDRSLLLILLNVSLAIMCCTMPVFAWLGDRIGRRKVFIPAVILFGVFSFAMFPLLETGSTPVILTTFIIGMSILNPAAQVTYGTILTEQFPTRFRLTGAGVSYQFAGLVGGGLGPFLAAIFFAEGGLGPVATSVMVSSFCALSLLCVVIVADGRKTELTDI